MEMKLELVPIPVADVDRAKVFYKDKAGFHLDHDVQASDTMRIVQFTPLGSACSIVIGTGIPEISDMPPGSVKALHLVVADIKEAHETLTGRGVDVGEIVDLGGIQYAHFYDPDGNSWLLQEIPATYRKTQ